MAKTTEEIVREQIGHLCMQNAQLMAQVSALEEQLEVFKKQAAAAMEPQKALSKKVVDADGPR